MFQFNSLSTLVFSLDSWLSRLKCWLQPDHSFEPQGDPRDIDKMSYGNPVLLCPHSPLSLDLPSPTINLGFAIDSEFSIEIESEPSSAESSRCHTPVEDYCADAKLFCPTTGLSLSKTIPAVISTNPHPTSNVSRDALLAKYSHQELVLLEFMTHTSDVQTGDIDGVLLRYPPGFSRVCRCTGVVEEDKDLCGVCQLLDAYMDYSLERFRGMDFAT